jgi:pantetheine-phosphate adenylyltransferase
VTIALYPGSFDPITNGHIDIANRASRLFEKLFVGVYDRPDKPVLFSPEERADMARKAVADIANVEVVAFSGLTVDFARKIGARTLVRGLRMSADFEREFDLAMMNKKLCPEIEIICLMSDLKYQFLSSSLLKEAARLGGDIDDLVPRHVAAALKARVNNTMPGTSKHNPNYKKPTL